MALSVINKINKNLKYIYHKNRILTLRRWLCNAPVQSHFHYPCSAWYLNLTTKLKNRIQTSQNKCIYFCLHKMTHIFHKEFENLNWLPVTERFNQCINLLVFKYVNDQCINYLNDIFQTAPENNIQTRKSSQNVTTPFCKANSGQMALSYIGKGIWSKTPETLNQLKNLDMFKQN